LDISEKRSTRDADVGIVCSDLAIFREFHLKRSCPRMPPTESIGGIGGGVFFQIRGQKTRFDKKKRFKILLEMDQNYGDGHGF